MPDHVHWLFQLGTLSLSRVVQAFKSNSARAVNAATGREGALWQPGFYDHALRDEEHLHLQARYIVENPVRRRLAARVGEYPHAWSRWIDIPDAP